ncbi:MAG TPA: hypothetical protein VII14_19495, partial [Xanthobacteraceae bacterium]
AIFGVHIYLERLDGPFAVGHRWAVAIAFGVEGASLRNKNRRRLAVGEKAGGAAANTLNDVSTKA